MTETDVTKAAWTDDDIVLSLQSSSYEGPDRMDANCRRCGLLMGFIDMSSSGFGSPRDLTKKIARFAERHFDPVVGSCFGGEQALELAIEPAPAPESWAAWIAPGVDGASAHIVCEQCDTEIVNVQVVGLDVSTWLTSNKEVARQLAAHSDETHHYTPGPDIYTAGALLSERAFRLLADRYGPPPAEPPREPRRQAHTAACNAWRFYIPTTQCSGTDNPQSNLERSPGDGDEAGTKTSC